MSQIHSAPLSPPPLAGAFLALADGDDAGERGRSPVAMVAALVATAVIALSAPLAWAAARPAAKPSDQPAATAASKAAVPAPDDDGADGGV